MVGHELMVDVVTVKIKRKPYDLRKKTNDVLSLQFSKSMSIRMVWMVIEVYSLMKRCIIVLLKSVID